MQNNGNLGINIEKPKYSLDTNGSINTKLGFYENGNLKHMLNYKNGKLNGAIKRMHRNGNSCLEEIYYNGIYRNYK